MSHIPQDILEANRSLTLALEALYQDEASIHVLSEKARPATLDEKNRLKFTGQVWERQIHLFIGPVLVLYGLTRVAYEHISRFNPPLDQLGTTPLGYWLFEQPSRERVYFKLGTAADIPLPHETLHPDFTDVDAKTLVRESLHLVDQLPISVVELILI